MKKTKRILSVILCACMLAAVMIGCGKKDNSGEVTLKWVIPQAEQNDAEEVEKLVNEKLAELLPNTKIEFVWEANLGSKWSMWMSAKQKYDIVSTYSMDLEAELNAQSLIGLNDLIDKYAPAIQKEMDEYKYFYDDMKVDGELYGIPNQHPNLHLTHYFNIPNPDWYQYFPVDEFLEEAHANPQTTQRMYDLLLQFYEKLTAEGLVKPGECSVYLPQYFYVFATRGFDFVGAARDGAWMCYDAYDKDAKIVSFFETDAYQLYIKFAAKLFDLGYVSSDYVATGKISGTALGSGDTTGMWVNVDDEKGVKINRDASGTIKSYDLLLDAEENMYNGTSQFGRISTYTIIPFTSENPERAMQVMNLVRSEEGAELLNLITYGIEGKHYTAEKGEDGETYVTGVDWTGQPSSSAAYGIPYWMVANGYLAYAPADTVKSGQKEWCKEFATTRLEKLQNTKYQGFSPDTSGLTYKIGAVKSVITEFNDTLLSGASKSSGYEATYKDLMAKLKAAGIDDIKADLQKQADAYVK